MVEVRYSGFGAHIGSYEPQIRYILPQSWADLMSWKRCNAFFFHFAIKQRRFENSATPLDTRLQGRVTRPDINVEIQVFRRRAYSPKFEMQVYPTTKNSTTRHRILFRLEAKLNRRFHCLFGQRFLFLFWFFLLTQPKFQIIPKFYFSWYYRKTTTSNQKQKFKSIPYYIAT